MEFRSAHDLSNLIRNNLFRIPPDVDLVVGVPRSGLLVAELISLYINIPLTDIDGLLENRLIGHGTTKRLKGGSAPSECKRILVVEDSVASGRSIRGVKNKLDYSLFRDKYLTLAAYVSPGKENEVDIALEVVPSPRCFEWNLFHHQDHLPFSCWDIDGVLCRDPDAIENDDGPNYLKFLENTPPNIIPTAKVGCIVTSRLEKYRVETERWLAEHNVEYGELIMLNTTAEERSRKGLHAPFKAEVYKKKRDMYLFIESNPSQALAIMEMSHKPVYCTQNGVFYSDKNVAKAESRKARRSRIRTALARFKNRHPWLRNLHAKVMKGNR